MPQPNPSGGLGDVYFDEYGRLYIANPALAREIQNYLDAQSGRRMVMVRDRFEGELRPGSDPNLEPRRIAYDGTGASDPAVAKLASPLPPDPDDEADPKVNMMCPCAPEP